MLFGIFCLFFLQILETNDLVLYHQDTFFYSEYELMKFESERHFKGNTRHAHQTKHKKTRNKTQKHVN